MRHAIIAVVIAGCTPSDNPEILWLGPTANGQGVVLTDREPFQY